MEFLCMFYDSFAVLYMQYNIGEKEKYIVQRMKK